MAAEGGMVSSRTDADLLDLDTRLLSDFIYELNVTRRHVNAYPNNHPVILTSADKVLGILRELLSIRHDIILGVAKDALLVGTSSLDRKNPVYRDVAGTLFSHGIASITFNNRIDRQQLLNFCRLISFKREQLEAKGGISRLLAIAGISGISITTVDYRAFHAREEEVIEAKNKAIFDKQSSLVWENFVRSLLEGSLGLQGEAYDLNPDLVAEILNSNALKTAGAQPAKSYWHSIAGFIHQLDESKIGKQKEEMIRRLSGLINGLTPELRRQFLNSAFSTLATRHELARSILSNIPEDYLIDALDDLNARQGALPQMLLNLVGKLSESLAEGDPDNDMQDQKGSNVGIREKLKTIFKEDSPDKFVPDDYQKALHAIISSRAISPEDNADLQELRTSLGNSDIEGKIGLIVLDIIDTSQIDIDIEILQRNLLDLTSYFLNIGEFRPLVKMYDKMAMTMANRQEESCREVMAAFSSPEFLEEVLNGLTGWGKAKYDEIAQLISRVGVPFVEPLLDRLAEEQNMSLRRYYMERLRELGPLAREATISRLRDNRWYFVRNLVLVLRSLEDQSVIPPVRRITSHPNPRVRQEAIRTLLSLRDPEADQLLLKDMDSGNSEVRITAVKLAEFSQNPQVQQRLLGFLAQGGLTGFEYELKSATIHSLGMIGNPAVIPELERFLKSRSLLRPGQLSRLKAELVQSLKHYPAQAVSPLLKSIATSGQRDLRRIAEELSRNLQGE